MEGDVYRFSHLHQWVHNIVLNELPCCPVRPELAGEVQLFLPPPAIGWPLHREGELKRAYARIVPRRQHYFFRQTGRFQPIALGTTDWLGAGRARR
jgi:hypothetical protein